MSSLCRLRHGLPGLGRRIVVLVWRRLAVIDLILSVLQVGIAQEAITVEGTESVLDTAALDRYRFLRNAYLKNRRYQVYDGKPPPEDEDVDAAAPAGAPAPTK